MKKVPTEEFMREKSEAAVLAGMAELSANTEAKRTGQLAYYSNITKFL